MELLSSIEHLASLYKACDFIKFHFFSLLETTSMTNVQNEFLWTECKLLLNGNIPAIYRSLTLSLVKYISISLSRKSSQSNTHTRSSAQTCSS